MAARGWGRRPQDGRRVRAWWWEKLIVAAAAQGCGAVDVSHTLDEQTARPVTHDF